jgi:hypothetical protein
VYKNQQHHTNEAIKAELLREKRVHGHEITSLRSSTNENYIGGYINGRKADISNNTNS